MIIAPKKVGYLDHERKRKEGLAQHCSKLRDLCIQRHLSSLFGVMTDYRTWIFMRYNLDREVEAVCSGCEAPTVFEVTEPIIILIRTADQPNVLTLSETCLEILAIAFKGFLDPDVLNN